MKLDELPELPFLKVLSYLSLQDCLMLIKVSKSCHEKVAISRVTSLCFSDQTMKFAIREKSQWVTGALAQNFISSTRFSFVKFFDTFGQTILSNLRHLRLYHLNVEEKGRAEFIRTLNLFGQLEQLDMVHVKCRPPRGAELNLPMLTSIHLENLYACRKFILNTPKLIDVEFRPSCYFTLDIVHGESVESLTINGLALVEVAKLKNLRYLSTERFPYDSTFLSGLEQLEEIHTQNKWAISELFEQKQRYGRADLEIYFNGLLLNGPDDPAIHAN